MASIKKDKQTGNWFYRVSYKEADGTYKTKTKKGYSTKKEAQIAANEMESLVERGDKVNENPVFAEHFQEWYELFKKDKYSAKNNRDIEHSITVATNFFKAIHIKDIDRKLYQKFLNWYGKGRATPTVKKVHIYTKSCLLDALNEGIIHRDPTRNILVRGTKKSKNEEHKFISKNDTIRLIQEVKKDIHPSWTSRYIILVAIATGMRFSEILALTWKDIDFKEKTISINKSYDHVLTKKIVDTKTDSSKRVITVDDKTLLLFKEYKLANQQSNDEYVFIDKLSGTVSNNAVNKALKKACKRADIKQITFHSLRHAHCSLLIYEGMNIKYISKRLGHSSISTTYQIYGHIIDEMEQKQNTRLNEIMNDIYGVK